MGMTFSEFGRRIKSNASGGTDHGAAAPVFYFGHGIKPGIIGTNPMLPPLQRSTIMYPCSMISVRCMPSMLTGWSGLDPNDVQAVLMGQYPHAAYGITDIFSWKAMPCVCSSCSTGS